MANIDKYYIALIDKVVEKYGTYKSKSEFEFEFESIKYSIVSVSHNKYVDLLTKEVYEYEIGNSLKVGSLIINSGFTMIPINMIIKNKKQNMTKSKIIKLLRENLIKLNFELLQENQKNLIDIFGSNENNKEKVKVLGYGQKIIQYIEEE